MRPYLLGSVYRSLSVLVALGACHEPTSGGGATTAPTATPPPPTSTATRVGASPAPSSSAVGEATELPPTFETVAGILFADRANGASACPVSIPPDARVRCLFDERYRGDTKAASLAHELFAKWHVVAGVEVAHTMDGGYRGTIRIEPALPIATERKHLEWIVLALRDFEAFFSEIDKRRPPAPHGTARYRFRPIVLRFMRSVAARTPSAYAHDWTVAWNLSGSLHTSADAARETLFHEIFHLNDYAHPSPETDAWSLSALREPFDVVVKKCGTKIPCLAPYSPNDTIVRGGTYYSFQPGNGVREYAAELALRYYRESRASLAGSPPKTSFKCGPPENLRAWNAMRDEFFAGVDVVPVCRP